MSQHSLSNDRGQHKVILQTDPSHFIKIMNFRPLYYNYQVSDL
jgi:hypothetical protein